MDEILGALLAAGAEDVVLKGIDRGDGMIRNYVASASTGVAEKQELAHAKLPFMTHGTSDAFASAVQRGDVQPSSGRGREHRRRVRPPCDGKRTQYQPNHGERGVSFELNLDELTALTRR